MNRALLKLVVLVSCAHALVHLYELALPSVEQEISIEFARSEAAGKPVMGWLSWCWRLPWGLGAMVAGWLVDRWGSRRMLAVYLIGCAAACVVAARAPNLGLLFGSMFVMGTLASISHPAGLALISRETNEHSRPRALGLHGIFGSTGISSAPFLGAVAMQVGMGWRSFYVALALPGLVLGVVFALLAKHDQTADTITAKQETSEQRHVDWPSYFLLTMLAVLQGFVYSGVLSFLPRYFSSWQSGSEAKLLAGGVLILGCIGQYAAGRLARADRLEWQLTAISILNIPFLLWMAMASTYDRAIAAGLFAVVHFMHQPIYNSLIAKYTPLHRRSLCYGFSFAMGLGVGAVGAVCVGYMSQQLYIYSMLAGSAAAAAAIGAVLRVRNRAVQFAQTA